MPASEPDRAVRGSERSRSALRPGTDAPSAGGPPPRRNSADPCRDSWSGALIVQESADTVSRTSIEPSRYRRRIQPIATRTTTSSTATLLWTYLATCGPSRSGRPGSPVAARASIAPPTSSSTCRADQPGVREKRATAAERAGDGDHAHRESDPGLAEVMERGRHQAEGSERPRARGPAGQRRSRLPPEPCAEDDQSQAPPRRRRATGRGRARTSSVSRCHQHHEGRGRQVGHDGHASPDRAQPGADPDARVDRLHDDQRRADAEHQVAHHEDEGRRRAEPEGGDPGRVRPCSVPVGDVPVARVEQRVVDQPGLDDPEGRRPAQPAGPTDADAYGELPDQQRRSAVQRDEDDQVAEELRHVSGGGVVAHQVLRSDRSQQQKSDHGSESAEPH